MENDKLFSIYAFTLLGGVAAILSASVAAGFATVPTPWIFAEHIAMSLLFRAAYKSFGGPYHVFRTEPVAVTVAFPEPEDTEPAVQKIAA